MTATDDEESLRKALAEAHRGDARSTPSFERVWGGARRTPRTFRPWTVLAAGLVAAVGLVVWHTQRPGLPPPSLPLGTRWIAPTDFLLDTPDLVTLRTVPMLDPAQDRFLSSPTDRRAPR